ncbi:MATE family efflux transporter [Pseudoclavibacter helvolus]
MVALILSAVANLGLDALFILVLNWGVAGAAVATGLANLVVVTYFVVWLTRNSEHVSLSPRWFTLAGSVQKPMLGVGVGTLLQSAFLIVTALVLNNLAAAYGEGPLAAMGVAVRIAQVPEFLIMGVTIGVLPLLAYSYGKGDGARFGSALRASAITVGAVAALAATLVLCFRDQVFTLFVADESVLAVGVVVLAAQLARDDRERLHGPHHLAVPGDRPCPPRDDHVGRSGGAVHSRRNRREHLARPGWHHLGSHRHRGRSAGRRSGPLRRVGSRTQAGPC